MAKAKLAEKRKEYSAAEAHLRRAVEAAPQQIGKLIELARFLARQGRVQEADQSLARAEKIAPGSPRLMLAKADLYIKTGRKLQARETAAALFERAAHARRSAAIRSAAAAAQAGQLARAMLLGESLRFSAQALRANPDSFVCSPGWGW